MEQKEHFHGSDLEKIEQIYGIKKENIISFSANVNPLGISPKIKEAITDQIDVISSYPDREYTSLRQAIALYAGCDKDQIIVGNGCTELISLFIQITSPKQTLLLGPTYSEYERDLKLAGSEILDYLLKKEDNFILNIEDFLAHITQETDLLIICNPNNPTGGCLSSDILETILSHCKKTDTYVMVDETYVEFAPDITKVSAIPLCDKFDNLIVLRGTSKFFAAPGLRLGYAACGSSYILNEINTKKNPWMLNSLAVIAGEAMFSDTEYIENVKNLMTKERTRMMELFQNSSLYKPYPCSSNFLLLEILDDSLTSSYLFDKAIRQNMMIRDCSTFPSLGERFIRFCFMRPEDNDRLAKCLLEL